MSAKYRPESKEAGPNRAQFSFLHLYQLESPCQDSIHVKQKMFNDIEHHHKLRQTRLAEGLVSLQERNV